MKKFLLMLGAVALFTACGDDSGSGSGASINYEEGYKYLTNLNVSDAKMIYQKSSATRATGDDSYYKLDLSGNEVKLSIKGEDGQDHNIGIHKVLKLNDKVLLVNPIAQDIIDLFYKPGPDDLGISVAWGSTEYLSIVDVQTEKIYRWPKEIDVYLGEGIELQSVLDNQGNIYIATSNNQICKLDVSKFTLQPMLADGQNFTNFDVTGDGFIIYWNNYGDNKNYKVKCPGGRIYPITDIPFIINNELYSYQDRKIIKWEMVGNNELKETEICKIEGGDEYPNIDILDIIYNYARKTVLLQTNYGRYYEFDGTTYQLVELPNSFNWHEGAEGHFQTDRAWYIQNNTRFYKMSMADYQESEFRINDYEIQTLFASPKSSNITFSGIRYMDGANVVGIITESDEVVIDNVADNGNKIINLISLN